MKSIQSVLETIPRSRVGPNARLREQMHLDAWSSCKRRIDVRRSVFKFLCFSVLNPPQSILAEVHERSLHDIASFIRSPSPPGHLDIFGSLGLSAKIPTALIVGSC
jgi:hypothetical protein